VAAMGGTTKLENIHTLVFKGEAAITIVGRARTPTEEDPVAQIKNLVETIDFLNSRAAFDYDIELGEFNRHRREVYTKYGLSGAMRPVGYMMVNDSVGTYRGVGAVSPNGLSARAIHDTPETLLHRSIVEIMRSVSSGGSTTQFTKNQEFNGKMCRYGTAHAKDGETLGLYFDLNSKLLEGYEIVETDVLVGDVSVQYIFEDYRPVEGLMLPHRLKIRRNGKDFANAQYTSITTGDSSSADVFHVPESIAGDAEKASAGDFVPLKLTRLAPGIFHAEGFSHNSLVVEFPNYVVIVEAPPSEVQSKILARLLRRQMPLKPIRYVVPTHLGDHTGGIRLMVALGADVLAEKRHEPELRRILETHHSYPKDELEIRRDSRPSKRIGSLETFDSKKAITDGNRTINIYAIPDSPRAVPMVVAYLPREKILFESDLYSPGQPLDGPAAANLFKFIEKNELSVDTIAGGHGPSGSFADFARVVKPLLISNSSTSQLKLGSVRGEVGLVMAILSRARSRYREARPPLLGELASFVAAALVSFLLI
jgi:hypothetical protein